MTHISTNNNQSAIVNNQLKKPRRKFWTKKGSFWIIARPKVNLIGGSCSIKTADIALKYFGLELKPKKKRR